MSEARIAHLQMIQGVVDRLARSAFAYKGWSITLVTGTIALSGTSASSSSLALLAALPPFLFWILDSATLANERRFRALFDDVRTGVVPADFRMNPAEYSARCTWVGAAFSPAVLSFYVLTIIAALLVAAVLG